MEGSAFRWMVWTHGCRKSFGALGFGGLIPFYARQGAAFISTLALTHLPAPSGHPANQAELLAVIMQPIVAFTILGSILIRERVADTMSLRI